MKKIGFLTIAQSPRNDILDDVSDLLPSGYEVVQRGALDGMTAEEVNRKFAPVPGDVVLSSRLRDGKNVIFAEKYILPKLQELIEDMEKDPELAATVLLCTGDFPEFSHQKVLFKPYQTIKTIVSGLSDGLKVGILIPSERQLAHMSERFAGVNAVVAVASPHTGECEDVEHIAQVAGRLHSQGAQLIYLNCMSYSRASKKAIQEATGLPVVLARTVMARVIGDFFGV